MSTTATRSFSQVATPSGLGQHLAQGAAETALFSNVILRQQQRLPRICIYISVCVCVFFRFLLGDSKMNHQFLNI